jgi:putative intracellular protease/amidase
MWDYAESFAAQYVIRRIYEAGGIVSAICHGPAALVNAALSDGTYLVAGKRVASFTDQEEEDFRFIPWETPGAVSLSEFLPVACVAEVEES